MYDHHTPKNQRESLKPIKNNNRNIQISNILNKIGKRKSDVEEDDGKI